MDQPLFAFGKQLQWLKCQMYMVKTDMVKTDIVMMGGSYIERASLKMIGQ